MEKYRHKKPPIFAQWILSSLLPDEQWKTPLGDFEEFYQSLVQANILEREGLSGECPIDKSGNCQSCAKFEV